MEDCGKIVAPLEPASLRAKLGGRKVQHEEYDHLSITAYLISPQVHFLHGDPSEWGRTLEPPPLSISFKPFLTFERLRNGSAAAAALLSLPSFALPLSASIALAFERRTAGRAGEGLRGGDKTDKTRFINL